MSSIDFLKKYKNTIETSRIWLEYKSLTIMILEAMCLGETECTTCFHVSWGFQKYMLEKLKVKATLNTLLGHSYNAFFTNFWTSFIDDTQFYSTFKICSLRTFIWCKVEVFRPILTILAISAEGALIWRVFHKFSDFSYRWPQMLRHFWNLLSQSFHLV